jgi:pimeloyl-ACP methyl ester carboxylesterase
MIKATASPKVDGTIRLRDGRRMAYAEWGDLAGRPIVVLYGTPGSRLLCPDEQATYGAKVRLLTVDRPGYGLSDPRPGRTLLNWADDVVQLAVHLDLPACPVVGWSGGGPFALALGFRVPDRVSTIGVAASGGPIDAIPGILETEGFSARSRAAIKLLRSDRSAGIAAIEELGSASALGWDAMFAEGWGEADERVLAEPATLRALEAFIAEAARQGSAGFVADVVAQYEAWGFSVADIRQPARVWCGAADEPDNKIMANYFATTIPRATLKLYSDEGHLFPFDHWAEMLAALR